MFFPPSLFCCNLVLMATELELCLAITGSEGMLVCHNNLKVMHKKSCRLCKSLCSNTFNRHVSLKKVWFEVLAWLLKFRAIYTKDIRSQRYCLAMSWSNLGIGTQGWSHSFRLNRNWILHTDKDQIFIIFLLWSALSVVNFGLPRQGLPQQISFH